MQVCSVIFEVYAILLEYFWNFSWSLTWISSSIEFFWNKKINTLFKGFLHILNKIKEPNSSLNCVGKLGFCSLGNSWHLELCFHFEFDQNSTNLKFKFRFLSFTLCCPGRSVILIFEEVNSNWRVRKAWLPARDLSVYLSVPERCPGYWRKEKHLLALCLALLLLSLVGHPLDQGLYTSFVMDLKRKTKYI